MSEENQRDRENNQQKKKTRRTRKDQEGRNFTCPCGKSYLSYPALYTHIKTKHHGKIPKQSTTLVPKPENTDQNDTHSSLALIKQYVQKYFPHQDSSVYASQLTPESLEYINSITESNEEPKDDSSPSKNESINSIFGHFLNQMKKTIKGEAYSYLCDLISCFQKYITEDKKDQDFCKNNNGTLLPHYFNDLIVQKKVPNTLPANPDQKSNYLTLACRVLLNLGVWLFEQKYTSYAVKFNIV